MITVLLADDNLIVREGVRAMLSREHDIEVVAVAADHGGDLRGGSNALDQQLLFRRSPDGSGTPRR